MPVTPSYTWKQTDDAISIHVAAKNVSKAQLDVVVADNFLKLNAAPYLLQLDLADNVKTSGASVTCTNEGVDITINKERSAAWPSLTVANLSKAELTARREAALDRYSAAQQTQAEALKAKKQQLEREGLEVQWAQETAAKDLIAQRKEQEKQAALQALNTPSTAPTASAALTPAAQGPKLTGEMSVPPGITLPRPPSQSVPSEPQKAASTAAAPHEDRHSIFTSSEPSPPPQPTQTAAADSSSQPDKALPAVRKTQRIQTKFTPVTNAAVAREKPAATDHKEREKERVKEAEKKKELDRQQSQKKAAQDSADHAIFLKDKGDKFSKAKAYQPAINAYTSALEKDPSLVSALMNRAMCYLQLSLSSDYEKHRAHLTQCVQDSTAALKVLDKDRDIMAPADWTPLRFKALSRRGCAYAQLGDFQSASRDYSDALEIDGLPEEWVDTVREEASRAKQLAELAKARKDVEFLQKGTEALSASPPAYTDAVHLLSQAIEIDGSNVTSLLRRAIAYCATGHPSAALDDINRGLAIVSEAGDFADPLTKFRLLTVKTVSSIWLGRLTESLTHVASAVAAIGSKLNSPPYSTDPQLQAELAYLRECEKMVRKQIAAEKAIEQAAELYASHKFAEAGFAYSQLLHLLPNDPLVRSNRAACHLHLGEYRECKQDCDRALELLNPESWAQDRPPSSEPLKALLHAATCSPSAVNSFKRQEWRKLTLIRRGTALSYLGELEAGKADLLEAANIQSPNSSAPAADSASGSHALDQIVTLEDDIALEEDIQRLERLAAAMRPQDHTAHPAESAQQAAATESKEDATARLTEGIPNPLKEFTAGSLEAGSLPQPSAVEIATQTLEEADQVK